MIFVYPIFYSYRYEVNNIKTYSNILKTYYYTEDAIPIVNVKQAGLYMKHEIPLLDIFYSVDKIVFMFDKQKSKTVYELWQKRELT